MFQDYPDIMSVPQVAQALGIGINTAYNMVKTHEIGCRRIGRKILIPKVCLIDFAESAVYCIQSITAGNLHC